MPIKTVRTWENINFYATSKDGKQQVRVELTLNHNEKTFELSTPNEDRTISLKGKSIVELELKLEAIKAAVNYTKQNLK